jgi:hypothetical protein
VFFDPDADPTTTPRAAVVCLDPAARACTFDEVELSWDLDTACAEARRCLRCDYGKIPNGKVPVAAGAGTVADTQRLLKTDASPPEGDGCAREKDAGSGHSGAIGATEDELSSRRVRSGGRGFGLQQPPKEEVK